MLSGEKSSPTRLIFQYMKALTNSEKLRAFVDPKMTDIITFLDNKGNLLSIPEETFMVSTVI